MFESLISLAHRLSEANKKPPLLRKSQLEESPTFCADETVSNYFVVVPFQCSPSSSIYQFLFGFRIPHVDWFESHWYWDCVHHLQPSKTIVYAEAIGYQNYLWDWLVSTLRIVPLNKRFESSVSSIASFLYVHLTINVHIMMRIKFDKLSFTDGGHKPLHQFLPFNQNTVLEARCCWDQIIIVMDSRLPKSGSFFSSLAFIHLSISVLYQDNFRLLFEVKLRVRGQRPITQNTYNVFYPINTDQSFSKSKCKRIVAYASVAQYINFVLIIKKNLVFSKSCRKYLGKF